MSPLGFWRRGQPRTYREQPRPKRGPGLWRRFTGFYFPPWVPVVAVILVVFGILGGVFFLRSATAQPRVGDHWHARYEISIWGRGEANLPDSARAAPEIHTHGDGIIHIEPRTPADEGAGSNLRNFFIKGFADVDLTDDSIKTFDGQEYKNGDLGPDGQPGVVQLFVNDERVEDVDGYLPQDGDVIRIVFALEEPAGSPTPTATPATE